MTHLIEVAVAMVTAPFGALLIAVIVVALVLDGRTGRRDP